MWQCNKVILSIYNAFVRCMDDDYQLELGNLIQMVILHFDYVDFPFVENSGRFSWYQSRT